jgi:hypothetical protein
VCLCVPLVGLYALLGEGTAREKALPLYYVFAGALVLGVAALVRVLVSRGRLAGLRTAVISILVAALGLLVLAPLMYRAVALLHEANCIQNLKQVGLSVQVYAQEHGSLPPPAETWCDRLMPVVRYRALLLCPEAPKLRSGYAFNSALSRLPMAELQKTPDPHRTVLLYESDLGWNGAGGPETLVKKPRHRGQDVFAFADGSARALRRDQEAALIWKPQASSCGSPRKPFVGDALRLAGHSRGRLCHREDRARYRFCAPRDFCG